ncbi:MAG TPA: folate-binding protein YgfZ [Rhodocyclaceae bacterium]
MNNNWNDLLTAVGARNGFADFGDPAAELAAAANATIVAPLTDLGCLSAVGEDSANYLHNLMTNDVKNITPGVLRRAGFCTPKGRLLADFMIWREGEETLLQLPAEILPAMLKKLSMFILRSKVKLTDASDDKVLLGLSGPDAAALVAEVAGAAPQPMATVAFVGGSALGLGAQRFQLVVNADQAAAVWSRLSAKARPVGLDAWRWLEIAAGSPRVVAATQEAFIPQMINYIPLGGVAFNKGCYPGQEIVARTQYLGKVKRHMFRAHLSAGTVEAGASVYAPETGEQACGTVVSAAPSPLGGIELLAVIQTSCRETGEVHLGAPDGPRPEFLDLPYSIE